VDSRLQVQMKGDGGGSARQSWMESSGLWQYDPLQLQGELVDLRYG